MAKVTTQKNKRSITDNPTETRKAGNTPTTRAKKTAAEKSKLDNDYDALDVSGPEDQEVDSEEMLRKYTNRVVAKRSIQIAKKLSQSAEEGNLTSAKLVLELVKKEKDRKKPSSKYLADCVSTYENDRLHTRPSTQTTEQTKERNA